MWHTAVTKGRRELCHQAASINPPLKCPPASLCGVGLCLFARRAQVDIMPSLYKCVVGVSRVYAVLLLVWLRCVPFFSQAGSCPGVLRWVGMRCIDGLGRVVFAPEAGRAYVFFCSTSRTTRGHTGGGSTAVHKRIGVFVGEVRNGVKWGASVLALLSFVL